VAKRLGVGISLEGLTEGEVYEIKSVTKDRIVLRDVSDKETVHGTYLWGIGERLVPVEAPKQVLDTTAVGAVREYNPKDGDVVVHEGKTYRVSTKDPTPPAQPKVGSLWLARRSCVRPPKGLWQDEPRTFVYECVKCDGPTATLKNDKGSTYKYGTWLWGVAHELVPTDAEAQRRHDGTVAT
jgi:hypothetical protein